jgi:plastocyanin
MKRWREMKVSQRAMVRAMAIWLTVSSPAFGQAVIEGSVTLPKPVAGPALTQRYQSKGDSKSELPEPPVAAVYLEGTFPNVRPPTNTVQVAQKNMQFKPGLLVVQKGTRVEFPNQDDFYHNVFSYSKSKPFDLGRYLKDEKPAAQIFDQPGIVKLYCEIHEHMRANILVVDTPHFVRTDAEGKFRLDNLPAGNFVLKVWLSEKHVLEKPVSLKDGETFKVDFPAKQAAPH